MRIIFMCFAIAVLFSFSACSSAPDENNSAENSPLPSPSAAEATAPPSPEYNNYNVTLEIEPISRKVNGIERVTFTNRTDAALDSVVMRVYFNAFERGFEPLPYFPSFENRIFLSEKYYGRMDISRVTVESGDADYLIDGTVLTVYLPEALPPGETVQIGLQFEAYVPEIAHRTGANDTAMWCGMFLPVLAGCGENGWRTEPYYPAGDPFVLETANYTVAITAPPEYIIAGSGVKTEEDFEDNRVTTFTAKMTRDFAFAVSDKFQIAETVADSGVTVQFYYYSEDANVDGVLDAAKRSVDYFEAAVGTYPFPNGNICIVETDMFVSGTEFSKIIFMDSARLKLSDFYNLTHSIGHQWFYNVVGSDQIREAWLDEALTLYVQEKFVQPNEADFLAKMESDYDLFTEAEGQKLSDGLEVYETWQDYYTVQSVKGKLMFFALNQLMGDEKFNQCIQKYYQTYSFKIAAGADFIAVAEEIYGGSLDGFFNEWLNGDTLPAIN